MNKVASIACIVLLSSVCNAQRDYTIDDLPNRTDTINRMDESGNRYGYWQITGSMKSKKGFENKQIVEEGYFTLNKRSGVWKAYYSNGVLKDQITYEDNRPYGPYKSYYENGNLQEEANWINNRYVSQYKWYYSSGLIGQIKHYDDYGLAEGLQQYFKEDGTVEMEYVAMPGKKEDHSMNIE